MTDTRSERAAIYCRISDDREGRGLGVARQEKDCRELAERLGWSVTQVFQDNDLSAYRGRRRPGYNALLGAIKAREVDGLLIWHNDRLHRNQGELETFISLVDEARMPIQTVTAGTYDLTTPAGRMTARVIGATARYESEQKAERQKAKHRELRDKGAPSGGTRPFGLTETLRLQDGTPCRELVSDEAAAIRHVAASIANGGALWGECRWLNENGFKGTLGNPWVPQTLTKVLTSDWVIGKRAGRDATWPAILDDETHRRVKAILSNRKTGRAFGQTLLAGIAACGVCGHTLVSQRHDGMGSYSCKTRLGGCGKIRIKANDLEEDLLGRLMARVDEEQLRPAQEGSEEAEAANELGRLEAVGRELAEQVGAGHLELAEYRVMKAANEKRVAAARARLATIARDEARELARAEAPSLLARWPELPIEDRRRVVQALCAKVEIMPGLKGRNFYVPDRLRVTPF